MRSISNPSLPEKNQHSKWDRRKIQPTKITEQSDVPMHPNTTRNFYENTNSEQN